MKKFHLKKLACLLIAALFSLGFMLINPQTALATSKTQAEGVAWANARAAEGWAVDFDGVYGCQCVDLTKAYYSYLGVSPVAGNGKDYLTNALPSGWQRVYSNPAPGDVFVMNAYQGGAGEYGHVGIVVAVNGSSLTTVECNWSQVAARTYTKSTSNISAYIRPNFANAVPPPAKPTVTGTSNLILGELTVLTWNMPANTTVFSYEIWYQAALFNSGWTSGTYYNFNLAEPGRYDFYMKSHGPGGISDAAHFIINVVKADYIPKKTIVYNDHIYSLYDLSMDIGHARSLASATGGHLVTINNVAEWQQLVNLMAYGSKEWYWTDATDSGSEGKWYWWSTGETDAYRPWRPGQPDNTDGTGWGTEDFGGIYKSDGLMNDFANGCIATPKSGLIVEIDASAFAPSQIASYGNNEYHLFEQQLTWKDAKAYCESIGGHLATITSAEEQAAVAQMVTKTKLPEDPMIGYYIGLTDEESEGEWRWITGEPFSYANWCTLEPAPEPSNTFGYQNFGWLSAEVGRGWHDVENYRYFGFICEFENAVGPVPLRGDADVSGYVDAADAAAILRFLAGLSELSDRGAINAEVTDVTPGAPNRAAITAEDAAKILRWLANIITVL
ncbi:MAG: CHAP domain-containing protein [Clostridiales bacterium]|nr:CHAP domain-containing protein [Clostridiales bacterium]